MTLPRHAPREMTLSRTERITQTAELLGELPRSADRLDIEDRLVRLNMPVARDVARRYEGRGIPADDLEQVAYLGLVKAVRHYDGAKATEFLSYAVPTIRGEVRRWFRDAGWMVRPPRSVQELQARITRARDELTHQIGRPPTVAEIARHLGVEEHEARGAMAANGCFTPSSLDAPSLGPTGEGDELADRLGGAESGYAQVEARVALGPLLRRLEDRERTILELRFVQGATQAEIGERLGVTQTQVSRLLSSLLVRLREELEGTRRAPYAA